MYAETGLLFPYFQNFLQDGQQLEEYCRSHKSNASLNNLVQDSTVSEYDLGGEGDLFKAPEPIISEPVVSLDPMTAAMSLISCADDVISPQALKVPDMESIQSGQIMSEAFYEYEKDLLAKGAMEAPFSEVLEKIPVVVTEVNKIEENKDMLQSEEQFPESVSSVCLHSVEWKHRAPTRPNFWDFPGLDFTVYGMRRAFSEGDIETLANDKMRLIHSPLQQAAAIGICTKEDRRQKLSRYRNKKTKRNFGRKIKYACRKALADSQPRVRGRFAKSEEADICKKQ
ncbi:CCT domain [Dillenia turbinata]|uniref:CCT domain n=1 Tax=Dillenia turbinata TaxID=194707 RepID=A0AAN8VRT6_9MAGN